MTALSRAKARINSRTASAFVALFLGLGLVFIAGLSQSAALHASTHDTRHSTGFPCH